MDVVAWRFIKIPSRRLQGIRALFKLSDEELDDHGDKESSEVAASIRLLEITPEHTREAVFIKTKATIMRSALDGAAAVPHPVVTTKSLSQTFHMVIVIFAMRIVRKTKLLTRRWSCGISLLIACIEHISTPRPPDLAEALNFALGQTIEGAVEQGKSSPVAEAVEKEASPSLGHEVLCEV